MPRTKQQIERSYSSFKFKYQGRESWFYLIERRGCSFHQVTSNGQKDVYGPSVTRLIKALVECGYIEKPRKP